MNSFEEHPLNVALSYAINGQSDLSEEILRSQPHDDIRVLFNLGWHEMRHGNMIKAFEHFNYGRFINVFGLPPVAGKLWAGELLIDKVVLFRCEGGFGDQILNFRFAKYFQNMGAKVIVSCAPELKEIFSRNGFICVDNEVVAGVYYDYWIPAMSAPYMLNIEYSDLDGSPYMLPKIKRQLYAKEDTLKVGVRWSGSPTFEHEQHRRFDSNLMIDLHTVPNTTFYSLQRDDNLIDGLPFGDLREQMDSWESTANIIAGLDLVITSCTSIAHLSGALGIPTWIVVPVLPYYTWAVPGNKSKWYDSVTLFRQTRYSDWSEPFLNIRSELEIKANRYKI